MRRTDKLEHQKASTLSWAWWYMPVIPATWEVEVGESQLRLAQAKSKRTYLKNN
jgi:hypothetical protein